jgi:hypothetical protein
MVLILLGLAVPLVARANPDTHIALSPKTGLHRFPCFQAATPVRS